MRHTYLTMIALAMIFLSCHSNQGKSEQVQENQTLQDSIQHDGIYHFQYDGFEMWTLQDKVNTMSIKLFPEADPTIVSQLVPNGEAPAAINTFLIKRNGQYILFDAGLGENNGGALLRHLKALDIQPSDINAVCITHFHGDHIGGMVSNGKANFPNAQIYFSAKEMKAWNKDENTRKMLAAYKERTHALADNAIILDGIITKPAPGHTPGHTLFQIGNVLIIGDLLHAAALQLPHPEYCARYDQDKPTAVKTRQTFYKYVEDNNLIVAGMHLPQNGVLENLQQ